MTMEKLLIIPHPSLATFHKSLQVHTVAAAEQKNLGWGRVSLDSLLLAEGNLPT